MTDVRLEILPWNECFLTGVALVDAQHRRLVDLVNACAEPLAACGGSADSSLILPLLSELGQYAQLHFRDEEAFMESQKVAAEDLERHQYLHLAFAREVAAMIQRTQTGHAVLGQDILGFLTNWLVFHILSEDKQLLSKWAGSSNAREEELSAIDKKAGTDSANAVLLKSLHGLFEQVSQRNTALIFANQELDALRARLESLNVELEQKVEQRTRELSEANEALKVSLAEVKKYQRQLVQSEKMASIGQLAAGVAHEINNPIGFVTSNCNTLQAYCGQLFSLVEACGALVQALPPDSPLVIGIETARRENEYEYIREDLPVLISESLRGLERVKRIVSDLMVFSQTDSEGGEAVDVNDCLERGLNQVWDEIKDKAEIVREYSELPALTGHSGLLGRVFIDLLRNAAQAIEGKGKIALRTLAEADGIKVSVSDTGCGIEKSLHKRIFEPFFTTKPVGIGTGLGLSVAWGIVRAHAGRIELNSDKGQGATFVVFLPFNPEKARTGAGGE